MFGGLPMNPLLKWMMYSPRGWALDKAFVRWTGVSPMNYMFSKENGYPVAPALYLVTKGAKTGLRRSVALPYFLIDGVYHLVGSAGGAPKDPGWAANLKKNPDAFIKVKLKGMNAKVETLQGEARAKAWDEIARRMPIYPIYQSRTTRELPVFALTVQ